MEIARSHALDVAAAQESSRWLTLRDLLLVAAEPVLHRREQRVLEVGLAPRKETLKQPRGEHGRRHGRDGRRL